MSTRNEASQDVLDESGATAGFCVGQKILDSDPPRKTEEEEICPVCADTLKAGDLCATDIEMGICHAECLEDSPVVDLDTGEPIPGGTADKFRYGDQPSIQSNAGEQS